MWVTSLHKQHLHLKASMAPFAGFEMPIQYTSIKEEVLAVRNRVGMFDVSHMGEFFVEGKDAVPFVDFLLCNNFAGTPVNRALYSPLCREDGTIIDDLIAYKLSPGRVLLCVNACNRQKDWEWITSHKDNFSVTLDDASDRLSMIAVQGICAESILQKCRILGAGREIPYYGVCEQSPSLILSRTGYTGEDGFEIYADHKTAIKLWQDLYGEGVVPCGLAARDVLRLEAAYPLYGHELTDEITPLDVGLKWTVQLDAGDFMGKQTLSHYKPLYRPVKLILPKGIPREDYPILDVEGKPVGKVTSGTLSVVLGRGIALGRVKRELTRSEYYVEIRGKPYQAKYTNKPFVVGGHK